MLDRPSEIEASGIRGNASETGPSMVEGPVFSIRVLGLSGSGMSANWANGLGCS